MRAGRVIIIMRRAMSVRVKSILHGEQRGLAP